MQTASPSWASILPLCDGGCTAVERINSQAVALGIERPHLRNGASIANQNTLIYLLINLRFPQRLRQGQREEP